MDKKLKELKETLDHTTLKNLDFSEKNKRIVRAAIEKQEKEKQRKIFKIPHLKYVFSVVASFILLIGALYYVMNNNQSVADKQHVTATNHSKQEPPSKDHKYTVTLADGMTSNDVKSKLIDKYHVKLIRFSHHYKAAHGESYNGSYTLKNNESFSKAVKSDKDRLTKQINAGIKALNNKVNDIKSMMNDPKSKGKQGVNQTAVNNLETSIRAGQLVLQQILTKPLSIKTIVIEASGNEAKKVGHLPMVLSITNGVVDKPKVPSQHPKPQVDYVNKVDMMNTKYGWGTSSNDIIRTTDQGTTWTLDNPKGINNMKILSSIFLSKNTALVFAQTNQGKIILYRTIDGGSHWMSSNTPLKGRIIPEFKDDQTGWVLSSLSSHSAQLYKTSNGGRTWETLPIPNSFAQNGISGMSFMTTNNGWVMGDINQSSKPWLGETKDGGRTWIQRQLPISKGFQGPITQPLKIFSSRKAILPVEGWLPPAQRLQIMFYQTTNQGKTWTPTHVIKPVGMTFAYDFINMKDGWVIDYKTIYTTHDGGLNWASQPYTVTNDGIPQASFVILDLEMTSRKTGLMVAQDTTTMKSKILITRDGGLTWTPSNSQSVMKQIVKD